MISLADLTFYKCRSAYARPGEDTASNLINKIWKFLAGAEILGISMQIAG
jgi:hypothetical protein